MTTTQQKPTAKKEVSFDATADEYAAVNTAVDRAVDIGLPITQRLALTMDLVATNANGCPLDFQKLLAFDDYSFSHDIAGIARHLDRTTGKLGGCFNPRCAKPASEVTDDRYWDCDC